MMAMMEPRVNHQPIKVAKKKQYPRPATHFKPTVAWPYEMRKKPAAPSSKPMVARMKITKKQRFVRDEPTKYTNDNIPMATR